MYRMASLLIVLTLSACSASRHAPSGPQLLTTKRQLHQQAESGLPVSVTCTGLVDIAVLASPAPDYDSESSDLTEKRLMELVGDTACETGEKKASEQ